jgi:hypothetical protein
MFLNRYWGTAVLAMMLSAPLHARQTAVTAEVLSPFGWRIDTKKQNMVVLTNHFPSHLKLQILKNDQQTVLTEFWIYPRAAAPLKDIVTKANFKDVYIRCIYDRAAFEADLQGLERRAERLVQFEVTYLSISWVFQQLIGSKDYKNYYPEMIAIWNFLLSDQFKLKIKQELLSDRPVTYESMWSFILANLGNVFFDAKEKLVISLIKEFADRTAQSYFESQYREIQKARQALNEQLNDKRFAERHTYPFKRICSNLQNFKDPIPNTVLSVGGVTGLYGNARWEDDDKFRLNPSFRFERMLFSLITTKSNFYTIGVAGFYENYRTFKGDIDEIEMSGYGGGLTLNFFTRQKLFFVPSFYVLSLEGGITRLSAEYKPFGRSAVAGLIEVPNVVPYGEFTLHLTPPFGSFGVDLGAQAVFADFKYAKSVLARERYPAKNFFRLRLGVSWYSRW